MNFITCLPDADLLCFSETFDDAERLLAAAVNLFLEGIVSKKRDQRYVSGKNVGWIEVMSQRRWRLRHPLSCCEERVFAFDAQD